MAPARSFLTRHPPAGSDFIMTIPLHVVGLNGEVHEITAKAGQTVFDAVTEAGIEGLLGECGGCCNCGTCHCYVEADPLGPVSPPDAAESQMLDFVAATRQPNSRLACQVVLSPVNAGLRILLPDCQF